MQIQRRGRLVGMAAHANFEKHRLVLRNIRIRPSQDHNASNFKDLMSNSVIWPRAMSRRRFLRNSGIASSALTLSPFFLERMTSVCQAATSLTRVYQVKNGDCFQNIAKLWQMLDGPGRYIGATDVVVIKGNAQWPNQGYTHTGCIKAVIDQILQIPGFSGEILICDNTQGQSGYFDASSSNRTHNWADKSWVGLEEEASK
jgi:hypothetical protein